MKLIKPFLTISGFTFLSKILGFVRDILIAAFIGAGIIADVFFVAFKLPNFLEDYLLKEHFQQHLFLFFLQY